MLVEGARTLGQVLEVNKGLQNLGLSNLCINVDTTKIESEGGTYLLNGLKKNTTLIELDLCIF